MRASPQMLASLLVSVVSLSCIAEPTTDITVPVAVASLSVEPTNAGVLVGSSIQLSATARDSGGAPISGLPITWTTSNGSIATVGVGGLVNGMVAGSVEIIATVKGKSDTAAITVGSSQAPLWTADMETGNLKQWEDNGYQQSPCGGQFNSGDGLTVVSTEYAHTGTHSAKLTIGGTTESGARMHRWCEPQRNRELYYSVWYYIPQRLTVSYWMSMFQYKSKPAVGATDPFFYLTVKNAPGTGAMRFVLTWWSGLTIEGPSPGQSGYRTWTATDTIPVGRWFQVKARYVCDGDFAGAIQVWQDGVEIFKLDSVRTRYPTGDCHWGVINYGESITPTPVVLYMDDAVISRSSIGH